MIGSLRIKVKDVVRNERIRDSWALQETQKGDIQLTLDWIPISLASIDETLEEPGDQFEVERLRKKQEEEEERRYASFASSLPDAMSSTSVSVQ